MKKYIYLLVAFIIGACSIDRQDVYDTSENGKTTLISISELGEKSSQCPNGGAVINVGIDTNDNGTLDPEEITQSFVLCNGANGADGQDGQDGQDGSNGTDGTDGQDGSNGSDGADGQDGTDGYSSLVNIVNFDGDDECPQGGVIIFYGTDLNRNGQLDESEVNGSALVCNGADGADGADGEDGQDGADGEDGQDGQDGEDGQDGFSSLIDIYTSEGCLVIVWGLDLNRNGELDSIEVTGSESWCDGSSEEEEPGLTAICHQLVIGNVTKYFTLYVPESALGGHLGHGDSLGECED